MNFIDRKIVVKRDKEVGIFKIKQQSEIKNNTNNQQKKTFAFAGTFKNPVGENVIYDGWKNNQTYEPATCFIKKVQWKKCENISSRSNVISQNIKQDDKKRKKIHKKTK